MVKKILVPTDASDYSQHAFETAVEYAKVFGAEIQLLHVVSLPPAGMYDFTFYQLSDVQLEEVGKQIFDITTKGTDLGDVKVSMKTVSGYPASEIAKMVKEDSIDLVIMGSQGRRPLVGALIGSVAQRVLADVRCPVLVVK